MTLISMEQEIFFCTKIPKHKQNGYLLKKHYVLYTLLLAFYGYRIKSYNVKEKEPFGYFLKKKNTKVTFGQTSVVVNYQDYIVTEKVQMLF